MQVKDVMSKNVASVSPDTPVRDVALIMKNMNIGAVPVCRGDRLMGIITDRDIVVRELSISSNLGDVRAEDAMTTGITTASPDMDVHEAADLMADKQIRRLPVVENGNLVGMLALGDLAVRSKLDDDAEGALSDISKPTHTIE
jgi:CBS domain-containing protein